MNVELEYTVDGVSGYKCRCCGRHLGEINNTTGKSTNDFVEEWDFCPYCGAELNTDYEED